MPKIKYEPALKPEKKYDVWFGGLYKIKMGKIITTQK
jgi:hypothetical protein